jgi:deoxyribonuclease-4
VRRVGAHLSIAGALNNAVDSAVRINADCLQIFSGSPRGWARKPLDPAELKNFKQYAGERDIRPIFVHALYLINLSSENKELVQKSVNALVHDLKFGQHFDCAGVVVHLGSHQGAGWEAGKEKLALLIRRIIDEAGSDVPFLIENSAGQKGKLCSDLDEIRWLLDAVGRPTLGWCYDICHGWATGYAIGNQAGGKDLWAELDRLNLWDSLKCIHANDSRDPFGSGRDRHDNVGKGNIPAADFKKLLAHPKLKSIPLITEAPGLDGNGPDAFNITALKNIVS